MAEVHRAIMTGPRGFQKTVALKRILPEFGELDDFRERFIEEARVAADLTHSNIVHVYDFGEIAGTYYIAMELVEGLDGDELVRLARNLGETMRLAAPYVVAQAARGLAFAHAARRGDQPLGLVHRDVSPQNLLISRTGEVKVTDFGIVKVTANNVNRLTATGAIMGKLRYMSPEQAMKLPLDGRSDIFALGLVLYELLTGEPLLDAPNPAGVIEQLKAGDFAPPSYLNPDVPLDLDAIVANALALDRDMRYGSADDLARDLERHLRVAGAGFGREEMRTQVSRLGPELAASRRARWQKQNGDAGARISPWVPVSSVHSGVPTASEDSGQRVTQDLTRSSKSGETVTAPTVSAKAPVVSGTVHVSSARRRGALALTIFAAGLAAIIIVVAIWAGRRRQSPVAETPAEAPVPQAAPLVVASPTPEPIDDGARRSLGGKPVVTDDDTLGTVARDDGEARELANARAATQNADRALADGNPAQAVRLYRSALDHYPGYAAAYRGLGQAFARDGNPREARRMFEEYLRAVPGAADARQVRDWMSRLTP